jgi:predicted dehydrogenase
LRLRVYGDKGSVEVLNGKTSHLKVVLGEDVETATWKELDVPPVPTNYQRFAEAVKTGKMQEPSFRHAAELQKVLDLALVTETERKELPTHA